MLRISKLDERRWLLEAFFGDELVGRCLSLTTDTTVRIGHNLDEAALSDKTPKYECPHGRSVCRTIPDALRGSSTITVTSGVRGDRPIRVTYKTRRPERWFLASLLRNLPSIPRWLAALFRPLMIIGGVVAGIVASVVAYRRLVVDEAVSLAVQSYWRQRFLSGLSKVLQQRSNQPMNE